jgi:hypothetical protein
MVVVANRSAQTHTVVIDVARELPEAASLFDGGLVRIDAKPRTTMYIRKA